MRLLLLASTLAFAVACSPSDPELDAPTVEAVITDAERADIDCLSAKSVTKITETIRDGVAAGMDPADLAEVPAAETANAIEQLQTIYTDQTSAEALKSDINYRLEMIQDAINNRNPGSDAEKVMNGTFELAATCTFGS